MLFGINFDYAVDGDFQGFGGFRFGNLPALGMPVNRIVKVYPKQHQVIVVYLNKKGQKCSSFFSYRLFARWQQETIATIASCRNQQTLAPLEIIVQYDLEHFKYPVAIADAIWDALLNHIRRVIREQRLSKQCA